MRNLKDIRWWTFVLLGIGAVMTMLATGYFLGQRGVSVERADFKTERDQWNAERKGYIDRFPVVRAQERLSCTNEYEAQLKGIRDLAKERDAREKEQTENLAKANAMQTTIMALITDMRNFLNGRAKVSDAALATARKSVAVSGQILETAKVAEQKATVAAAKADETASAVKSVDKKLETATHGTAAVPPTPWIGNRRAGN